MENCDYVFLRRDAVKKPLTPAYSGPHKVISRAPKYFTIIINNKPNNVCIDRVKPAFLDGNQLSSTLTEPSKTSDLDMETTYVPAQSTKSGRHVHWPARFATYLTY